MSHPGFSRDDSYLSEAGILQVYSPFCNVQIINPIHEDLQANFY
jgi:hypothetical protein